jgi:hypothetical protein
MKEYICIRYKNKMYTIDKLQQESNDKANMRLWFMAKYKESHQDISEKELICLSHMYINEKYMNMKY